MQPTHKPNLALVTGAVGISETPHVEDGDRQRSDEELVIAAQGGDAPALDELLSRHRTMLYCSARRIAVSAEEAEDVVQESMLRVFTNIGKFRGESRFVTWLVAIVINAALSIRRKEKGVHWIYLDEQNAANARACNESLRDVRLTPEDYYSRRELSGLLRREIGKLHPKYRSILQECDLYDCSLEQAAQMLGITLSAAKSRLHRARHTLRAASSRYGATRTFGHSDMASVACPEGDF